MNEAEREHKRAQKREKERERERAKEILLKGALQRLSTENDIIASGGIIGAPCCDSGDGSVEATTGAVCSH